MGRNGVEARRGTGGQRRRGVQGWRPLPFLQIKATCRKRAEYNLELAQYDFAVPSTLQDEEIEAVLAKADDLVNWAGDVKDYALHQALSGKQWAGWKLVEGRSNRRYVSEDAVAAKVEEAGFDPYEKSCSALRR